MATIGSGLTRTAVAYNQIPPSRFVKNFTTQVNGVLIADANAAVEGISQQAARTAPIPGASTLAADTGESLSVYTAGCECQLEAGAVIVAGDYLKSDSVGRGVPSLTTGTVLQNVGAVARQAAAGAGELIRVEVLIESVMPA